MTGESVSLDALAPLLAQPEDAAIIIDYDGTLSPIVDDPTQALPLDGVPELLDDLTRRYARVAVVSGRPLAFLLDVLPHSLILTGLYGLEALSGDRRFDHPHGYPVGLEQGLHALRTRLVLEARGHADGA